jgi:hypothetical protein
MLRCRTFPVTASAPLTEADSFAATGAKILLKKQIVSPRIRGLLRGSTDRAHKIVIDGREVISR